MAYLNLAWKFRKLILVAALAIFIAWLWNSKTSLERDLARANSEIARLEVSVDTQNAAVDEMARLAAEREKQTAAMLAAARKTSATHYRNAQDILKAPQKGDDCSAALNLLREYQQ